MTLGCHFFCQPTSLHCFDNPTMAGLAIPHPMPNSVRGPLKISSVMRVCEKLQVEVPLKLGK